MDKVTVVATYSNRSIRSSRMEVQLPSVIALKVRAKYLSLQIRRAEDGPTGDCWSMLWIRDTIGAHASD